LNVTFSGFSIPSTFGTGNGKENGGILFIQFSVPDY
jgi:hypothetical protein